MENLENCDSSHTLYRSDLFQVPARSEERGLLRRLFPSFFDEPVPETEAHHEIHGVKQDAAQVKSQLEEIKKELLAEVDQSLASMVEEVVDPMLRALDKAGKGLDPANGANGGFLKMAQTWTEKAKGLVDLYAKCSDKERAKQFIIARIVDKTVERVERDIKFLEDYLEQMVDGAVECAEERVRLKSEKRKLLQPHIDALTALKSHPESFTIQQANLWRRKLAGKRAKYMDAALHAIED